MYELDQPGGPNISCISFLAKMDLKTHIVFSFDLLFQTEIVKDFCCFFGEGFIRFFSGCRNKENFARHFFLLSSMETLGSHEQLVYLNEG